MRGLRAATKLAAIASVMFVHGAAQAQLDDRTVASIFRECRKIEDFSARVACYENIPIGFASDMAGAGASAGAGDDRMSPEAGATGFGRRQLSRPPAPSAQEPARLTASVTAVTSLTPGVYVITLADGAQWQFVDTVSATYDPPRRGTTVAISTAALGSYLMTYDNQRAVRVRRVR